MQVSPREAVPRFRTLSQKGAQLRKIEQGSETITEWAQWVYTELRSDNFFGLF